MDSPVLLEAIPKYQDMLSSKGKPRKRVAFPSIRPSLEDYANKDFLEERWWEFGGEDTPAVLWIPVCNYYDALFKDKDHLLPCIDWGFFSVVEDLGVVCLNNTNRSGGEYFGDYRSFLVKLRDGSSRTVNISVFGIDPGFEDRGRGYTSLIVSTSVKSSSHNILQLNIDDFAELTDEALTIRHNGRISSLKSSDLMDFIKKQDTKLKIDQSQCIFLGSLPAGKLYRLDDPDIYEFTCNLIEYGLLREKFREAIKKRKRARATRKPMH